ncbi:carbohydrate ABC transporter substrate-binding protein (CUT1 family) [Motilibacter rhizosphaerae]|uniref:Carbohydrate ABC transporter substrate-binding protein (CUT1 family) n=1 Tax=Motilibacter rhizosphaerae TaxID=598652 RepID=A0A4Q7NW83_9ACTN|nr:ABC transporter substrate-binding protein [Motilibacter rhizosphaerae]RZS91465.1 carbohydrate ABC transporter substrate-binding protein (CUT1 family) [Motilibacter rhizosphaerae]
MKKQAAVVLASAFALAACGSSGGKDTTASSSAAGGSAGVSAASGASAAPAGGEVAGDLTVLTHRTDLVNTVFKDYAKTFEAKYPEVHVKFEAVTDYEQTVRTRLNTNDYGDVVEIPGSVTPDQLSKYFVPLGTVDEESAKYNWVRPQSYQGESYGRPIVGNAQGILYNRKVWTAAGVTDLPKTPDEFLADLQKIKDTQKGVTPFYTNYKDGWPVTQWIGMRDSITGDPDVDNAYAHSDAPWASGTSLNITDTLLYDIVHQGLAEKDPTTTNWEASKKLIGTGKVATMALGSWAIVQMQAAAPSKDDIGYMPYPYQKDGKFYSQTGGDYNNAISIHSKNKAAAKAWIDWFSDESGYADHEGGIPVKKGAPLPATLSDFTKADVQLIELNPAPAGEEGLFNRIDQKSEIGVNDPKYHQRIIDAARGAKKETLQQIFDDLDAKWAAARKSTT